MDRELWTLVLATVKRAAKEVGWNGGRRTPGATLSELADRRHVPLVRLARPHAELGLRPRGHYAGLFRPPRGGLPSVSQFSRRVKSDDCQAILQRVHDALGQRGLLTDEGYLDGKAMLVSPVSKDRQATRGKVSGGFAKGYKLHAFVNEHRRVVVWSVTGLHADEKTVAMHLLPHLAPSLAPEALVLKDSNYDSAPLHKGAAEVAPDARLVGPLKGQDRVGAGGHHPVTLRQMGPGRRELLAAWQRRPGLVELAMRARDTVQRVFGVLVSTAGGLGTALPPWVRTLDRVTRWVGVKVILYNARLAVQDRLREQAAA